MQNYCLVDKMFAECVKVHNYGGYLPSHLGEKKNHSVHGTMQMAETLVAM